MKKTKEQIDKLNKKLDELVTKAKYVYSNDIMELHEIQEWFELRLYIFTTNNVSTDEAYKFISNKE